MAVHAVDYTRICLSVGSLTFYNHNKVKGTFQMKKLLLIILSAFVAFSTLFAAPASPVAKRFPAKLVNAKGQQVDSSKVLNGKMVAVYFSASWCPPCRAFTPQLVKFYKAAAKKGNIEIVLVSSDKNAADMMKYMKKYNMPWYAIPHGDAKGKALMQELKVTGIPMLVVFDRNGRLITKNARGDVASSGVKAVGKWQKSAKNTKSSKASKKVKKSGNN